MYNDKRLSGRQSEWHLEVSCNDHGPGSQSRGKYFNRYRFNEIEKYTAVGSFPPRAFSLVEKKDKKEEASQLHRDLNGRNSR